MTECRGLRRRCGVVLRDNLFQDSAYLCLIVTFPNYVNGMIYFRYDLEPWIIAQVEDLDLGVGGIEAYFTILTQFFE